MKKQIGVLLTLGMMSVSYGAITIDLVGDGSGYDETGVNGFRSTGVSKSFDLDGDNVYGSQGLFFFGDGLPDDAGGEPFTCHTQKGAAWATFSQGSNFLSIAEGASYGYAAIDDPNQIPHADVMDWGIASAGGTANTPGEIGSWCEILTFDIDATTPSMFRIGILAGNMNSINWNPSGVRISVDGGSSAEVTGLDGTVSQANMVFFDVHLNGATSGTFSIQSQRRATLQGTSFAGVTFDDSSSTEWPGGALALEQDALSMALVAPLSDTNSTINALYLTGEAASEVEIISATADAGFSASYVNSTLGTANTNEAITVSFDNTSIGLGNGESTNSTLVVTWTEVGSGVTNTSEAALTATYINDPSRLELDPASISMILNAGDASTSGTVTVSYVEGTLLADVEVLSISAASGFTATPDSFTLNAGNPTQDVTVVFSDPGGLAHNDVIDSSLTVTWTETGSGVQQQSNVDFKVIYNDPPDNLIETWTIGIDFGTLAPTGDNTFNQWDAYNNTIDNDASVAWSSLSINAGVLQDLTGADVAGVGLTVENQTGQNTSRADVTNGSIGPSPFDADGIYQDSLISNQQGAAPLDDGGYFVLTFTGLDDSLTYGLSGGYDGANANFASTWSFDSSSSGITMTQNDAIGSFLSTPGELTGYQSVMGLKTDGNGNLQIQVTRSLHINVGALTLTAFEEGAIDVGDVSIGVVSDGTQVVLSWEAKASGTYGVEATENLVYGPWTNILTGINGVNGVLSVTNDLVADQYFYRAYLEAQE